jgi:hypothetical protein
MRNQSANKLSPILGFGGTVLMSSKLNGAYLTATRQTSPFEMASRTAPATPKVTRLAGKLVMVLSICVPTRGVGNNIPRNDGHRLSLLNKCQF